MFLLSNIKNILNILDVIIFIIFIFCIYMGYKKGFIRTLFDLISIFFSVFLSVKIYPVMNNFLKTTNRVDFIKDKINNFLLNSPSVQDKIELSQADFINNLPIPSSISNILNINNNSKVYDILNVSGILDYISTSLTNIIINIISCILVFIITYSIIKLIANILDIFAILPVINTFNKTFGILIGIIKGFLICWIFVLFYSLIFIKVNPDYADTFYNSKLSGFFYNSNIILDYIVKNFKF